MGKVCRFRGVRALTAEMNIAYLSPVRVDEDLVAEGYEKEMAGRNLHLVGEIKDALGKLLARSRGRFVVIDRNNEGRVADAKGSAPEQI
jgi:acyl-CoA thioesterase FadM